MTWQQIARLFEEMELRLIASLVRNLAGHREGKKMRTFTGPPGRRSKSAIWSSAAGKTKL